MLFQSTAKPVPDALLPDDLTLAQFMLDSQHPLRNKPVNDHLHSTRPRFIDAATGESRTYEDCKSRTQGLANALSRRGIVCISSPNNVDYPIAIWAVHRIGAIVSPANPSYSASELCYQLDVVQRAKLIIAHPTCLATAIQAAELHGLAKENIIVLGAGASPGFTSVDDLIAEGLTSPPNYVERKLQPGEAKTKLAFLSFSSGTTGKPKAVAIPHYAPISNVIQIAAFNRAPDGSPGRFNTGQTSLAVLPMYHIYCLVVVVHLTVFVGHRVVVMEKFDFAKMLQSIVRHKICHLFIVPPMIVLLCKHPSVKNYDLSHVRYVMSGAAPLTAELQQRCQELYPNMGIFQGYGTRLPHVLTGTVVTMAPPYWGKAAVKGCAGLLVNNTVARVLKEDGTFGKYGETGELHVRGPQMALAYYNNEAATKEGFEDGWVKTGDIVQIHENGNVFEFLKVRGFQVAPAELEGHIIGHEDVADAGVVGVKDEFSGEVPVAYVVLTADAEKRALQDGEQIKRSIMKYVADHKVNYKHLHAVTFIDAVPKNPSGKILRRLLRERAATDFGTIKARL
ncbi:acetyl-CoA synthetase-like protein [Exidia glandulosa HHB12029]|uniref:Acetyl-CoA synthetase-like protein n=1 Tax=Exidia glandulosa HHB12029 TaxID=1314781 RepID=A0A165ZGG6_EXIGL|nr:acetyl-CoA synthetase-like protein [Exidia glandulosa HHB12029]